MIKEDVIKFLNDFIENLKKENKRMCALAKFSTPNNELHKYILMYTQFLNDKPNVTIAERIYCIINNITEIKKCQYCNKNNTKFEYFTTGYRRYCSVNCGVKNEDVKQKRIKTVRTKYGVDYLSQIDEIKEKKKNTCLTKYGEVSNLCNEKHRNENKRIMIEKYGADHPSKCETLKEKRKQTCLTRYGIENPFQLNTSKEKRIIANLMKYGTIYPLQSDKGKRKVKDTCLKKYGVEHPMQVSEYFEKQMLASYNYKNYTTSTGNILTVQGYEVYALDILLNIYNEEDIITKSANMPEIWYIGLDNKSHRYYPDIFIKTENKFVEVKSNFTFEINKEINLLKQRACKEYKFKHEIWIIDNKQIKEIIK